jgi:1-pyrroline-5-carboxylate dehydrogenase
MANAQFVVPAAQNDPVRAYARGSAERAALEARIASMRAERVEIPLIIGGEEVYTGKTVDVVCPHEHGHVLATLHQGDAASVARATAAAAAAWHDWSELPWEQRAAVFLRAADLLAGEWRPTLNAATMLGQSKSAHQAEIDSACELIDFWRFNTQYMVELYRDQPISSPGCWNRVEHRALEGFVFAVAPFNFTSIAGNLPTAPALMGNTVVFKPASTAALSSYYIVRLLEAAGLPPGVINFVPGPGGAIGTPALSSPDLAGVHFTGSTAVFKGMWKLIGQNIDGYRYYPRLVGETGGKNFVLAHVSCDVDELVTALVRGAFEYQGQKCSAASRAYIPASMWPRVKDGLLDTLAGVRMGGPENFENFVNAVIDGSSHRTIMGYIDHAKRSPGAEILAGGKGDSKTGWFVEPTVIQCADPRFKTMVEEIFGPVLSVFVYADDRLDETIELCDVSSPYALTGAVFGRDRGELDRIGSRLRHAAGNFYVNDKPTGAVVGQQPFGGGRASGTNDKAGSKLNLLRWTSVRAIKETFAPPRDYRYPFMT